MNKKIAFAFLLLAINFGIKAQSAELTRVLFLVDGSGSMLANMGKTDRMQVAKKYLAQTLDSLKNVKNLEIAMRVFGHTTEISKRNCNDTRLEVPFGKNNINAIKDKLFSIVARGYTPIAQSLLASAGDFPVGNKSRNIIILITDGIEECTGDPCAVSQELQKKGIFLKPFIVGIGVNGDIFQKQYACVGKYYNAETEEEFGKILGVIISQALNRTTSTLNLLDINGMPLETNVGYTVYDAQTGLVVNNYVHTMNGRGYPDTLYLDPLRKYDIVVHTLPKVEKKGIELTAGRHNIIAIDAPQGDLELIVNGVTKYSRLQAIVRKKGDLTTINAQEFGTKKRYLVGSYDLEILTTPRIYLNEIKLKQNNTTKIEIPQPGVLNIQYRRQLAGAIYTIVNNKVQWVTDINTSKNSELLTLQPGKYKIIARPWGETRTIYSFETEFTITSGSSKDITL